MVNLEVNKTLRFLSFIIINYDHIGLFNEIFYLIIKYSLFVFLLSKFSSWFYEEIRVKALNEGFFTNKDAIRTIRI